MTIYGYVQWNIQHVSGFWGIHPRPQPGLCPWRWGTSMPRSPLLSPLGNPWLCPWCPWQYKFHHTYSRCLVKNSHIHKTICCLWFSFNQPTFLVQCWFRTSPQKQTLLKCWSRTFSTSQMSFLLSKQQRWSTEGSQSSSLWKLLCRGHTNNKCCPTFVGQHNNILLDNS